MPVWRSKDLHDTRQLLLLVFTGEDRISSPELSEDTAKGPHVNAESVAAPQYDLGTAIEAALDVGINLLLLATTAAEVDNSDIGLTRFTKENVLWLQVAVDDVFLLEQD